MHQGPGSAYADIEIAVSACPLPLIVSECRAGKCGKLRRGILADLGIVISSFVPMVEL